MVALSQTLRLDLLLKLTIAILLGGLIGLEREIAGKPAGLRTNILICVGSALISDVSVRIGLLDGGARVGDPARLAAQIVSGVGFLGAGTIMQARGTVIGLTSAATIWVVAAIGIAIGAGFFVEATGTGLLVAAVLSGLGRLEQRLRRARRVLVLTIRARPKLPLDTVNMALRSAGVRILEEATYDHLDDRVFELKVAGPARQFDVLEKTLPAVDGILDVNFGV